MPILERVKEEVSRFGGILLYRLVGGEPESDRRPLTFHFEKQFISYMLLLIQV